MSTQESLQAIVRVALHDQDQGDRGRTVEDNASRDKPAVAVPTDHHIQRWMTDGGTSADDRRWAL